jgi:hypothetical protein
MTAKKPSKPIFSGYQTITLDPYCPYQTRVIGHIGQTFVSGYLGIWHIWETRFVITLGILRCFLIFPPIFGMIDE